MEVSMTAFVSIYFFANLCRFLAILGMVLAVLGEFFALRFVLGGFGDLQIYNKIHVDRVRLAARLAVLGGFFAFRFVLGGFGDLQI